jgi:predicted nucleic acid-binding protein
VDRLFIDANVLFSAAYRAGAGIARLWTLEEVELLSSDYAVEEARRNLSDSDRLARLEERIGSLELVAGVSVDEDFFKTLDVREKDWPILGGALAGRATHLITGDHRDFGALFGSDVRGVKIMPPADYFRKRDPESRAP